LGVAERFFGGDAEPFFGDFINGPFQGQFAVECCAKARKKDVILSEFEESLIDRSTFLKNATATNGAPKTGRVRKEYDQKLKAE